MKVAVLGGGVMGSGIAQVALSAGCTTVLWEREQGLLDAGLAKVRKAFERAAAKGKITPEQKAETLARLSGAVSFDALRDADFVLEAVVEDLEVKRGLFRALDAACAPKTVFATNTSSLKVSDLAVARPDRFCGLHFFNPAPLTKLVEVVRAEKTSDATADAALSLGRSFGKTAIAARDNSGFVVNYILVGYLMSAVRALENGFASVEDIDLAMLKGCAHPVGPLALIDMIGVDTVVKIADIMRAEYRDSLYDCPAVARRMAEKGWHGTKTGKGFYDYAAAPPIPNPGVSELL